LGAINAAMPRIVGDRKGRHYAAMMPLTALKTKIGPLWMIVTNKNGSGEYKDAAI
jgi:hypothetical protein